MHLRGHGLQALTRSCITPQVRDSGKQYTATRYKKQHSGALAPSRSVFGCWEPAASIYLIAWTTKPPPSAQGFWPRNTPSRFGKATG